MLADGARFAHSRWPLRTNRNAHSLKASIRATLFDINDEGRTNGESSQTAERSSQLRLETDPQVTARLYRTYRDEPRMLCPLASDAAFS